MKVVRNVEIGVFVLEQETVFTEHYETAAWFRKIKVPAGEYPVRADIKENGEVVDFPGPRVRLPGVVVASDFSALLAGVVVAPKVDQDVGEPAVYAWTTYSHALAKAMVTNQETPIRLHPYVVAMPVDFTYDGKRHTTYRIMVDLSQVQVAS